MKHASLLRSMSALTLAFSGLLTMAQDQVDIGLYQRDGHLEVTVRPQQAFDGIFSAVVFTLRWDGSTGATLGPLVQEPELAQYMAINPSGGTHTKSNMRYQIYAGFGINPMASANASWQPGQEYVIATIPVQGKADIELVNDSWTGEPKNNGDFYLSLGGADRTGVIYKGLATAAEGDVQVRPNPNNGQFTIEFANEGELNTTFEIVDPQGKIVFTDAILSLEGPYRRDMDLGRVSAGVYVLKLQRGEAKSVHKIVVR